MSKIKAKITPIIQEISATAGDTKDVLQELKWNGLMDDMGMDTYFETGKVERRGRVREFTAGAAGALAIAAAATGRRKWAAGLAIYAAGQVASDVVDRKISQRGDNTPQSR